MRALHALREQALPAIRSPGQHDAGAIDVLGVGKRWRPWVTGHIKGWGYFGGAKRLLVKAGPTCGIAGAIRVALTWAWVCSHRHPSVSTWALGQRGGVAQSRGLPRTIPQSFLVLLAWHHPLSLPWSNNW